MNRERIESWCERGILGCVLAILVYGPLGFGAVRGLEFGVIQLLTVAVLLLWVARLWFSPRPQLLWPPICWAVLAFTAYAIGRYFTADIEYVARHEVMRVVVYACLFLAILNNLHRQESVQAITFTLLFVAMGISFYAFYQFVTDSKFVWNLPALYPHRGSGTYICPNHLGGLLEMLLPLGLAYTIAGRMKPVTRVILGYVTLVLLAGIGVTLSRGSWFSTALALLLFFAVLLAYRKYRFPVLVALVVLVGTGYMFLPRSLSAQLRLKQLSTQVNRAHEDMRFALWTPAFHMWQEHPWWGVGPGHFDPRFRMYRPEGVQLSPDRVHNDYLNTLADWGLAGAGLVAAALGLLAWGVVKTWGSVRLPSSDLGGRSGSNKFAFMLGATAGLIAIAVHGIVDFNLQIPGNAILAISLMSLITSHLRFSTERYWKRAGIGLKVAFTIVLVGGAVALAQQGSRSAVEWVRLERAARTPAYSPAQVELLKRAWDLEPTNPQTVFSIGEALQVQSQEGGEVYAGQQGVDYRQLAEQAMEWFKRGMALNRWDSRNYAGYGWGLDWLERHAEAEPFFAKAEELDPNNYYNLNRIGFHYVQLGDFAAARPWFERSLRLEWVDNSMASGYLEIANRRLLEGATNHFGTKPELPPEK